MQKHSFDPSLFSKKPLTKIDSNFSKNPLTKIDSNLSKNPLTKLDTNFSKKPSTKFESNISKRPLNKTPSFVPSVVIMGISGRGKSNLLNYLMQHPAEAIKNPLFPSKAGAGSCTIEVSEPLSGYIYGTNQKITVFTVTKNSTFVLFYCLHYQPSHFFFFLSLVPCFDGRIAVATGGNSKLKKREGPE